jgi:two-component system phosphate regulon sensor histidine kinase PhoR
MTALEIALALALAASLAVCAWLLAARARPAPALPERPAPEPAPEPPPAAVVAPAAVAPAVAEQPLIVEPPPAAPGEPAEPPSRQLDAGSQPLFQAAAATLDVGMAVVDASRQVRFVNPQALAMLDAPSAGGILLDLLRDPQADALVAEVLRDGEPRETAMKPVGSGRTLRLGCTPLGPGGALAGALLLIRDITQISMLERSRRDLVANVSHELRTPLASLKLLVETVQSEPPPEVARRMLGQMSQEIDAVTQLVDELHELSQIESGRVTLKLAPQPIRPVVERALERIRPQADRKRIQVGAEFADAAATALMDVDRIGQVLLNLLHNAVKFTSSGGTVTVRTELVEAPAHGDGPAQQQALWLRVSVHDTGIGIPAQELPRIFERFYKVDRARTRNAGGTGLGLAIAKHLVEGHGGRLSADSAEGQGSTFSFTLPAA